MTRINLSKGTNDLQNVKILVSDYDGTVNLLTFQTLGFSCDMEGTVWRQT